MPKTSKVSASEHVTLEGYEGASENLEGGWTVFFESYSRDVDLAEFLKGLPDDKCQAEHLGYVVKGKVAYHTANGVETFETGDAYYVAPGHTPVLYAGSEVIEFSPTEEITRTLEVASKNMAAAAGE